MILIAVLEAQAGKEKEMEAALKAVVPKVKAEEGTVAYVLHRSKENPAKFLFYEKYKDEAAMAFHGSTPYLAELFANIGPLLAGQPVIQMYEELASI